MSRTISKIISMVMAAMLAITLVPAQPPTTEASDMVREMAAIGHGWKNPIWRHEDGSIAEW